MERIKTHIKGLDQTMEGGIPKGHIVLVTGKPGTMKSSLAFYVLHKNAQEGNFGGVYVTLEQSRTSILSNMEGLGMKITNMKKDISILDMGMIRKKLSQLGKQTWLEVFKMYLGNLKKNMDIGFVIIDSLPVLEIMAHFDEPREDLFHFFEWLRDLGVTTFLIMEMEQGSEKFCKYGEDFLGDGVIHLDLKRESSHVNLFLSIVKMRETHHQRGYFPLIYDNNGFEVVIN